MTASQGPRRARRSRKSTAILVQLLFFVAGFGLASESAQARNVYLNGVDISAARTQELKKVDIVINERGDVYIIAPHYQVNEEDTYIPLSRYVHTLRKPEHKTKPTMLHKPGADADNATSEEIQQGVPHRLQDKVGDEVPAEPLPSHPGHNGAATGADSSAPATAGAGEQPPTTAP